MSRMARPSVGRMRSQRVPSAAPSPLPVLRNQRNNVSKLPMKPLSIAAIVVGFCCSPLDARQDIPAGLWFGEVAIHAVSPGKATNKDSGRSLPTRLQAIIHVDANGTARLLSQAFLGVLPSGRSGITIRESALDPKHRARATRLICSQMPLEKAIPGSGRFATGDSLTYTIGLPRDNPTNPPVESCSHEPDQGDAKLRPLPPAKQKGGLERICTYTFTSSPRGWRVNGSRQELVCRGNYSETIRGTGGDNITVSGTFTLRRISEITEIFLN